ncbi:hypothetical protein T4D_13171 [Trichinella pseudospiralis]|uniref:Uncharacterized protein n=1 Tax=Trichinella pseudospiralis TaxID=6337 RepID=A0A0V1G0Y0_TRIPS|nr:hypothetical protein T4D_13171 [Trichinella pseudospiralis]
MIKRPSGCSLIKVVQYQQGRCLFTQYRPVPVDCEASTFLGPGTGCNVFTPTWWHCPA